jgi:uncharacterized membrane protein
MGQMHSADFANTPIGRSFEAEHHDRPSASDRKTFRSEPAEGPISEPNVGDSERALSLAAGVGLGLIGLTRGGIRGLALTAIGAGLAWRGYSGHCSCYQALGISTAKRRPSTAVPAQQGCKFEKTIVIARKPADLYRFWRRFENLTQVMRHLKNVRTIDNQQSHWVAEGAFGKDVEWDAEIINERENEMIAWRSLSGGDIETAGSVHFRPLDGNRGTEVTVSMKYNPPAGKVGAQLASLFGAGLEDKLNDDLESFKQVMETGMHAVPSVS